MRIKPMYYTAKNGQIITMRSAEEEDGEQLRQLAKKGYEETRFLSREAEEFDKTAEQESAWILHMLHDPRTVLLFAELDGQLLGNAMMHPVADAGRQKHRCQVGITILKEHWGKGIGTGLFILLIAAAREAGFEQMELEVVSDNERGIRLYEKMGFKEYGRRPNSFKYKDGTYADMTLMALDLRIN